MDVVQRRRLLTAAAFGLVLLVVPQLVHAVEPASGGAANCDPGTGSSFDAYRDRGWLMAFLASFGFGFLTSLTPCVYPMIPIVLGVFGARGKQVSRGKAMGLATLYVIGMGVTYATLGVVFAMVGGQFGSFLANPWVVGPIVLLYLALAASMFGAFELNLPASWQAKLNTVGGAGYGGAFAMGLVGGFTAAPCTGPFLVGILGFVAHSGNVPVGASLLFVYALGMGVLFWVLAAFAVSLPKSGRWMEWIKSIGGVALLVAAIYFLRPVVGALQDVASASLVFLAVAVVLTLVGAALGAIHLSFSDGTATKVRKAAGVLFMVVGLSGVVIWIITPDRHLPWIERDATSVEKLIAAEQLQPAEDHPSGEDWLHRAEAAAFAKAAKEGKGVMIDFSADWCLPCQELEIEFAKDDVYESITANFVPLKIDITDGTDEDFDFKARYGAGTLPAIAFVSAEDAHQLAMFTSAKSPTEVMDVIRPATDRLRGKGDQPCAVTQR